MGDAGRLSLSLPLLSDFWSPCRPVASAVTVDALVAAVVAAAAAAAIVAAVVQGVEVS